MIVLYTNCRKGRLKRPIKDISPSPKSVILVGTSPPLLSSEVQQINSSTSSMLASSFPGSKATLLSVTLLQTKAAAFIPANPPQFRWIRPMSALTSSLVPSCSRDKQDALDEQVPSSTLWSSTLELEKQGCNDVIRTSFNYLPNVD